MNPDYYTFLLKNDDMQIWRLAQDYADFLDSANFTMKVLGHPLILSQVFVIHSERGMDTFWTYMNQIARFLAINPIQEMWWEMRVIKLEAVETWEFDSESWVEADLT